MQSNHGRMLTVKDGWLECPNCRRNKRVMQIPPYAVAHRVIAFCRACKWEHDVDIAEGQCFESRGQ